jgi:hypothetical protein
LAIFDCRFEFSNPTFEIDNRRSTMISVTCTSCKSNLEIDDAFAGGVCRCQHCGAIQTVPAHLRGAPAKVGAAAGATAATVGPGAKKRSGRTLYRKSHRLEDGMPSSGLDQIAQAVASSGLSSGLHHQAAAAGKRSRAQTAMLVGGVVAGALLFIVAIIWFAMRGSVATTVEAAASPRTQVAPPVVSPAFCGQPIAERSVVYVLDRGSATGELFSYLKEVSLKSAQTLGEERKFQIIFWNNGTTDDLFPRSGPTFATAQNVDAARQALDAIYAHGQSDVTSALTAAVSANPDAIFLATGKGSQLSDDFVRQVLKIRGSRSIRINTIDVGAAEATSSLKAIADQTGGKALALGEGDLKKFARE